MAELIPLEAIPQQSLSIVLDDIRYRFLFRSAGDIMAMDLTIDDAVVLSGHRCVAYQALIPYAYLTPAGNFYFITEESVLPDYTEFGNTQFLHYLTEDEVAEFDA